MVVYVCGNPACKGREFNKKQDRDQHWKRRHGPRPFKCNLTTKLQVPCTSTFAFKKDLTFHVKRCHTNNQHSCPEPDCAKTYSTQQMLTKHLNAHARIRRNADREKRPADLPPVDPTAHSRAEIIRFRELELARRTMLQYMEPEDISHEFDPAMKVSVKEYNEAMILKFPDLIILPPHRFEICPGQTFEIYADSGSCLFGVQLTVETAQYSANPDGLKLRNRCAYCYNYRQQDRGHASIEEKKQSHPGKCLWPGDDYSCMNQQREGVRECEEHYQLRRSYRPPHPGSTKWLKHVQSKYEESKAKGECREITTSLGMQDYLESTKGRQKLTGQWGRMKQMALQDSALLFSLDLEYAGQYPIEAGIVNGNGDEVLNTLLLHDKSWRQIYEEGDQSTRCWMNLQRTKFQWDANFNFPAESKVMNARQVASILRGAQCHSPDARFIEYSRGNQDLNILHGYLEKNGGFGGALGGHYGNGLMPLWLERLPGFWNCAQDTIFILSRPEHPLAKQAHRAMVDAQKLLILFRDLVNDSAA